MTDTRERIVGTAFKLFMQKSFKEVTIKEIVEKTGVSQGAFFHYFKTKEDLFLEVIGKAVSSAGDYYNSLAKDSLQQFYRQYIQSFLDNFLPEIISTEDGNSVMNYFSLYFEAVKIFPDFKRRLSDIHEIELNSWKSVVSKARANGEISSVMKDEEIANMFINSGDGLSLHIIYMGYSNEDVKNMWIALWDGFYEVLKCKADDY
ncbi:TetR/AcrR family transcriptional regulator [Anoxynatronum buryatiense]|uniref:Transcriptional regulator, TetR family n=1 Tax=Anoxynatronum buryatiense TaxID=489973 RepID=A0AA45WYR0_9CLOT|nr:TetR/AcrR family transcriptional regulator [Anoxynatronum buryatiense]SMP68592.1 transcriptional regulator, TetR family [Anoxynatronum buryatiense]